MIFTFMGYIFTLFLYLSLSRHCLDSMSEHLGRIISNSFMVSIDKIFDTLICWPRHMNSWKFISLGTFCSLGGPGWIYPNHPFIPFDPNCVEAWQWVEVCGLSITACKSLWKLAHILMVTTSPIKVGRSSVFSRSTNLESKLIEFFVFVNF